jgi:soluble lytic murein transglycosylase-like protein
MHWNLAFPASAKAIQQFAFSFSISLDNFNLDKLAKANGYSPVFKVILMAITKKNRNITIKTIINKKRRFNIFSLVKSKTRRVSNNIANIIRQRKKKIKMIGGAVAAAVVVFAIVSLYIQVQAQAGITTSVPIQTPVQNYVQLMYDEPLSNDLADEKKKQVINNVLREKGVELSLGWEIAHTIVEESKKTDIPIEMYLAIMQKESTFRKKAVSSAYAKGLMQIRMGTWDAYVKKHNLSVTRKDIFLPTANIKVASVILQDLHSYYARAGYQEPLIWDYVLASYFAGPASVRNGIKHYHQHYINKVKQYYSEFEQVL